MTSRNPVYSALWFASVVLSTAGLFLLAGAPFLAAGTVIVYAGAIIVTFLFVIMLAQMEGKAVYDRAARAPGPATFTCFLLFWCLIYSLVDGRVQAGRAIRRSRDPARAESTRSCAGRASSDRRFTCRRRASIGGVVGRVLPPTSHDLECDRASRSRTSPGWASRSTPTHLVTVGLAGVLLFVALIGAVAITDPEAAEAGRPDA